MFQTQQVRRSREVQIWKTLKLGICKSGTEYQSALKRSMRSIGPRAEYILGTPAFACSHEEREVDLVAKSVSDLCSKPHVRYNEICAHARTAGLELCPAEVRVALSCEYDNQACGDWLIIAMKPIVDFDEAPSLFVVSNVRCGGLRLSAICANPEYLWSGSDHLVFACPR